MSDERIKQLEAALKETSQKMDEQRIELEAADERYGQYKQQIRELETELEHRRLSTEMKMLQAVEEV